MPPAFALTAVLSFAVYHAIYLEELTAVELTEKIAQLFSISPRQISQIYKQGPTGIHVLISDEVGFSVLLSYPLYPSCDGTETRVPARRGLCFLLKGLAFSF